MYCKSCGAEFNHDEKSCPVCGAPNEDNERSLMDFYEEVTPEEDDDGGVFFVPKWEEAPSQQAEVADPVKRRKNIIMIGGCVLAMCVVAAVVFVLFVLPRMQGGSSSDAAPAKTQSAEQEEAPSQENGGEKAAPEEETPAPEEEPAPTVPLARVDVTGFPVIVEGLVDGGSRVPIVVSGTQADGIALYEEQYVDEAGNGLSLPPGTYVASIAESPISARGGIFHLPDGEISITITDGETPQTTIGDGSLELVVREPGEVTEEQIEYARQWVSRDPQRADRADELATIARQRYYIY